MFERNQILSDSMADKFDQVFTFIRELLPSMEAASRTFQRLESAFASLGSTEAALTGLSCPSFLSKAASDALNQKRGTISNIGPLSHQLTPENALQTSAEDQEKLKEAFAALCEDPKVRAEALSSKELQQAKERIAELSGKLTQELSEKETIVENYETQIRELSNQLLALLESKSN